VDEAGRATQPPLILTPLGLEPDPDAQAEDPIVDNDTMSSSPTRSGSSRSGAARRAEGTNGTSSSANGSPASEASAGSEDVTESASDLAPLPAETIGKAKSENGRSPSATRADAPATRAERQLDQPAGEATAAGSDRKPVFTPASTPPATTANPSTRADTPVAPAAAATPAAPG
jgi:hypothetical protein